MSRRGYPKHAESSGVVETTPELLFSYLDDPARLSSHMTRSSWRMGGGRMTIDIDQGRGQRPGSRVALSGVVLGIRLSVETSVLRRQPPHRKVWETVGDPRLLVIGHYRMAFEIEPEPPRCRLRVLIDYQRPRLGMAWLFGQLAGSWYAQWCVDQMVTDAQQHFRNRS